VRAGTFRSDLYYRLRVVMLRIPPLRNRREDIPFLIETMLEEFVRKHHIVDASGKPQMPQIAPDAIELLISHEWRGNIRELRNTLEQLVVLVCSVQRGDRCTISRRDVERALSSDSYWDGREFGRPLPAPPLNAPKEQTERELLYRALIELRTEIAEIKEMLRGRAPVTPSSATLALPASSVPAMNGAAPIKRLDELEWEAIEHALEYYHGNRRQAATALGISERSLYRKLKEKGIE
jgi:DNA-binding NtrC family response regulator